MRISVVDAAPLRQLLKPALTLNVDDRYIVIKGIDYSYYSEETKS